MTRRYDVRRGDFSKRVRVRQRDQLGALGESFNEMTSSISELIDEQRQRQRLENEISIAREVQAQLFPQSLAFASRASAGGDLPAGAGGERRLLRFHHGWAEPAGHRAGGYQRKGNFCGAA